MAIIVIPKRKTLQLQAEMVQPQPMISPGKVVIPDIGSSKSLLVWKDVSGDPPIDEVNKSTTIAYSDLSLTSQTSSSARVVFLELALHIDSITPPGYARFHFRKKLDSIDRSFYVEASSYHGDIAGAWAKAYIMVGMDIRQTIQWSLIISGTIQVDCTMHVLAYIK